MKSVVTAAKTVVRLCLSYSNTPQVVVSVFRRLARLFDALPAAVPVVRRRPVRTFQKKCWSDEDDANLRLWYGEGVVLAEIGLRFGVNYWAVMHRARRLGLPKRSGHRGGEVSR